MTKSMTSRSRVRLAGAIVVAAMALPGVGVANHVQCDNTTASKKCPAFNPQLQAGPQVTFTDAVSGLTFRLTEQRHGSPTVAADYYVPNGFRFALGSLRQAQSSAGAAATSCGQIFNGLAAHTDNNSATLGNAENLAGSIGFTAGIDMTGSPTLGARIARFGYTAKGPSATSSAVGFQRPALAFLDWDGTTARFCYYAYAADFFVDHTDDTGFFVYDNQWESSRQHLIPVTMTRLLGDPLFDWKISLDFGSIYHDPWLWSQQVSVTQFLLYFEGLTGGNWNRNPVTNAPERLAFGRTPTQPGTYTFRGVFRGCRDGIATAPFDQDDTADNPPGPDSRTWTQNADRRVLPAPIGTICRGGAANLISVTKDVAVDITPPPVDAVHDYGRIKSVTAGLNFPGTSGITLLNGKDTATVKWSQPTIGGPVKAYALSVAPPGDTANMHKEYIVTDPTDAAFDARNACGADGAAAECAVDLVFPLSSTGGQLRNEGVYDMSLITIFRDGHRSDGRCDDGTVDGAACNPELNDFRVIDSFGKSLWQVVIRERQWPLLFGLNRASRDRGNVPSILLFLDYAAKRGELWIYSHNSPSDIRAGTAIFMQGDNAGGQGVYAFGSPPMLQSGKTFNVVGVSGANNAVGVFSFREDNRVTGPGTRNTVFQFTRIV